MHLSSEQTDRLGFVERSLALLVNETCRIPPPKDLVDAEEGRLGAAFAVYAGGLQVPQGVRPDASACSAVR